MSTSQPAGSKCVFLIGCLRVGWLISHLQLTNHSPRIPNLGGSAGAQLENVAEVLRHCASRGVDRSSRGTLHQRQEQQGPTTTVCNMLYSNSLSSAGEKIKSRKDLRTDDCKMARAWVLSTLLKTKRRSNLPSKNASQRHMKHLCSQLW
jgi:hypothetical protein